MGGEIGVSSEPGLGSRFWFTIRVSRSGAPTRAAPSLLPQGRRALVVESSRRWCRIIEEHLVAWGLTCDVFPSGRPALEALNQPGAKPYDVAVVGAHLRDIGIEVFIKELRQKEAGAQLPLILLTQLGTSATLTEVESEVAAQLAKPLRLSELYDCIVGAFAGKASFRSQPRIPTRKLKAHGKRILIVDDNEINQFVATEQVELAGFDVDVAGNGQKAVELVMAKQYAAVLMDCQMPVMDGYTAARTIRDWERGSGRHVPIIALTAHAMAGERDKVLAAGMDDYLSKPLRAHALERMLERYIGDEPAAPGTLVDGTAPAGIQPNAVELDPDIRRSEKLSRLFIDRVPEGLDELDQAISSDPERIRERAHKLKGSCLAVGAEAMAEEAEDLQHEAELGQTDKARERATRLREQFGRVRELLLVELAEKSRASQRPPAAE
jgi:CheY-like chemotaxis protein/HPt (histidine-containing phosphotransfer) domain-containing protein